MKKQPEQTAATRQTIIEAFWKLYSKRGIEKTTVKDIIKLAGYNRSTFYEYFTDARAVLEAIKDRVIDSIKQGVVFGLNSQNESDFITTVSSVYERESKYLYVLLGENGDSKFAGKLKMTMRPAIYSLFRINEENIENEYILEFVLSGILSTLTLWHSRKPDIPLADLISLMRKMMSTDIKQVAVY